jgi:hypothetical protein
MNRTNVIQWIIDNKKFTSYLEIGVWKGRNFNSINVERKVSVDPYNGNPTYRMTSDQFFEHNIEKFDLIFIDGLHHSDQLLRDIDGALRSITDKGIILLHDCLPQCEEAQVRSATNKVSGVKGGWTGDCWKAFAHLRATREDLLMLTLNKDHGIGVIFKNLTQPLYTGPYDTYQDFVDNKSHMMHTCSFRFLAKIISKYD